MMGGGWQDELRKVTAEALGTAFLLAAIVGSGIVVQPASGQPAGPASMQLFVHAVIIGLTLTAAILTFGPVSGAHFNPVVTLVDAAFGGMPWRRVWGYVAAQLVGAMVGTIATAATFALPLVELATTDRGGGGRLAAEVIATAGLVLVIFGQRPGVPGRSGDRRRGGRAVGPVAVRTEPCRGGQARLVVPSGSAVEHRRSRDPGSDPLQPAGGACTRS